MFNLIFLIDIKQILFFAIIQPAELYYIIASKLLIPAVFKSFKKKLK
jgi:hypothetical protein